MPKLKDGFKGERALVLPPVILENMEKDPLLSMLYITDIGYYPKAYHHFRERTEPISQYVLVYCMDGSGWFSIGNRQCNVKANQYFILPPGVAHAYATDEDSPWTIYWIHFKGKLASYYMGDTAYPIELKPGVHSRINQRINLFEEIFATLKMGYSNENLRYVCSMFHHYLGTLRYWQQYRNAGNVAGENDDAITAIIHYMKENIEKKISLSDIAGYAGYSPSHFSALFQQQTGYSPMVYFNQLKIQQACELLDFTDMKINQICYKIGIEDTYYFSRLFNQVMGISPREYRKVKKG